MPIFLTERNSQITELMDNEDCDRALLNNTYRQFSTINSLLSGWKKIYKSHIRPLAANSSGACSLLDIGFGGGDIPIKLAKWAARDNIQLHITAIETDHRAMQFVKSRTVPQHLHFTLQSSKEVLNKGRTFDIVISNHLMHHLEEGAFYRLLDESKQLSNQLVLFNDIERSDIGYALFNTFSRPFFNKSFITEDGLRSIKRSYTLQELQQKIPEGWKATRLFPFRLLLSYKH